MKTIKPGLYVVTNGAQSPTLEEAVTAALAGGATLVQYRNKNASSEQRFQEAMALKNITEQYGVPLIINDDLYLAELIDADGVHLGQKDASVLQARELLGDTKIIGITCHSSVEDAKRAEKASADYVAFGCCFPSQSKPDAIPLEWEALARARKELSIPIIGIGGITLENAKQVLQAGASTVAVISDLFTHPDIKAHVNAYTHLIQEFHS